MIYRRFSQHVRAQNWFAVGLDLLVVIIGIFLGFQLTEWNQARKDRALEKQYLARMLADVDESLARFQGSLQILDASSSASTRVAQTLFDRRLTQEGRAEFEKDWRLLTGGATLRFISSTINELRDSGRMDLIRSDSLRIELGAYMAGLEWRYESASVLNEALQGPYEDLYRMTDVSPSPGRRLLSSNEELMADRGLYRVVNLIATVKTVMATQARDFDVRTRQLRRVVAAAVEESAG